MRFPIYYFYDGNLKAFFEIDGRKYSWRRAATGERMYLIYFNEKRRNKAGLIIPGETRRAYDGRMFSARRCSGDFWMM